MIQSIERAGALLEVIARHGGATLLAEIPAEADIGKTTAHNILKTLAGLGYVGRRTGDVLCYRMNSPPPAAAEMGAKLSPEFAARWALLRWHHSSILGGGISALYASKDELR